MKSRLLITKLDVWETAHNRLDKKLNKKLEQIIRGNWPGSYTKSLNEIDQEVRQNHQRKWIEKLNKAVREIGAIARQTQLDEIKQENRQNGARSYTDFNYNGIIQ